MDPDVVFQMLPFAVVYAALIGWVGLGVVAIRLMHRRIAALEAIRPGQAGMFGDVVPYAYFLILPIWSISLPLGLYWLVRRPELARQGRITVLYVWLYGLVWLGMYLSYVSG